MGHSEAINKNVYECPMAIQEITRVGKMLSNVDNHAFNRENVHEAPHDMTNPEGSQQSSSACQALETLGHQNGSGNEESEELDKQTACKNQGGK